MNIKMQRQECSYCFEYNHTCAACPVLNSAPLLTWAPRRPTNNIVRAKAQAEFATARPLPKPLQLEIPLEDETLFPSSASKVPSLPRISAHRERRLTYTGSLLQTKQL
jgi:hypothetical protein